MWSGGWTETMALLHAEGLHLPVHLCCLPLLTPSIYMMRSKPSCCMEAALLQLLTMHVKLACFYTLKLACSFKSSSVMSTHVWHCFQ